MKKVIALLLIISCCLLASCSKSQPGLSVDQGDIPSSSEPEKVVSYKNPLTGLEGIDASKVNDRPVAIMINNISVAQPVQTGINKADIIYETEVEGGITRLMAVFQDVTKAEKIGTIRSARYPYVDLAMGLNAIYVHCGEDKTYCSPHLKDIDDISISENNYGVRISNGLAREHTLYTYTQKLWSGIVNDGIKTTDTNKKAWAHFSEDDKDIALENPALSVNVAFSRSYKTTMKYEPQTKSYVRYFNNTIRNDYYTKQDVEVKNVFVLLTTIKNYSDNYHRQVLLESGDGYYCVNGTYKQIKWSKGNASNGFTFTNTDGTELTVNPGTSWVCIADMKTSQPTFE